MSPMTKPELLAVTRAYDAITALLETTNHATPYDWRNALKALRRDGTPIDIAKAMMVREFAGGVRKPCSAAELYHLRDGARLAHMLGAAIELRATTSSAADVTGAAVARAYLRDDLMHLCDLSSAAWNASLRRSQDGGEH